MQRSLAQQATGVPTSQTKPRACLPTRAVAYQSQVPNQWEGEINMSEPTREEPTECESCHKEDSELSWYDNGITCDGAWYYPECIGNAEMEL